jgi:hypothetical protein
MKVHNVDGCVFWLEGEMVQTLLRWQDDEEESGGNSEEGPEGVKLHVVLARDIVIAG